MNSVTDEPSAFEQRARLLLNESVARLPASVRSRLTRARHAALSSPAPRQPSLMRRWAPAGAGALAVAMFAVMFTFMPHGESAGLTAAGPFSNAAPEDLEMLADSDGVQLSADQELDNDFYEWAVGEAKGAGAPSVGT